MGKLQFHWWDHLQLEDHHVTYLNCGLCGCSRIVSSSPSGSLQAILAQGKVDNAWLSKQKRLVKNQFQFTGVVEFDCHWVYSSAVIHYLLLVSTPPDPPEKNTFAYKDVLDVLILKEVFT